MLLTSIGIAKIANSQVTNETIDLTQMAVGDSNGAYYNPTQTATALKNETWRGPVSSVAIDEQNPNWVVIDGVIPASVGGFTIREVGLFDSKGDMIAIGKVPETYKPTFEQGSSKDLYLKSILEVSNASVVTIKADPSVIIASKKYVDDKFAIVSTNVTYLSKSINAVNELVTQHLAESTVGAHKATNISVIAPVGITATSAQQYLDALFQGYSSKLNDMVDELLLMNPSLPLNHNSTMQDILNVLASGEVSSGKKFATGTTTPVSNYVTVNNLNFVPKLILISQVLYKDNALKVQTIYSDYTFVDGTGAAGFPLKPYIIAAKANEASTLVAVDGVTNYVNQSGFKLRIETAVNVKWVAVE